MEKCGLCGEEIKEGNYVKIWNATENKLVMIVCRKCYSESKDANKRIREMLV